MNEGNGRGSSFCGKAPISRRTNGRGRSGDSGAHTWQETASGTEDLWRCWEGRWKVGREARKERGPSWRKGEDKADNYKKYSLSQVSNSVVPPVV